MRSIPKWTDRKAMKSERENAICTAAEDSIIRKLHSFKYEPVTENDIVEDLMNLICKHKSETESKSEIMSSKKSKLD
jgi:hypothetical protein